MTEEISSVIINEEELIQDDEVCEICRDGEVYEGNEILFCDKCNVAVHQSCYGVKRIPTGNWFCDVCKSNGNPLDTRCELCKFTGGAYKQSDTKGLWVHQLCANWQPEVYVVERGGQTLINVSGLDKARLRLKCSHCLSSGGASVQCSYGRCTVAVHPWCCLHDPKGFTKRIVKTPDGDNLWEIFCKTHAASISDPVKPHTKKASRPMQVRQSIDTISEVDKIETVAAPVEKVSRERSSRDSMPKVITLSMDHAISLQRTNNLASSLSRKDVSQSSQSPNRVSSGRSANRTFPIRTMSEWPGQSEGEGMDLDHFWNVIAMYHPEDHPAEWFEFMKSGIEDLTSMDFCMPCLGSTDTNVSFQEEERLFEGISEKQRESIYDYEQRSKLRTAAENVANNIVSSSSSGINPDVLTLTDVSIEKEPDFQDNNCFLNDDDFFVKQRFETVTSETIQPIDKEGFSTISAVFDGEKRAACDFRVKLISSSESSNNSIDVSKYTEEHDKWVQSYIFQPDHMSFEVGNELKAVVELKKVENFPDDTPVILSDKIIIPNDENDVVSRAIRADQETLQKLSAIVNNKLKSFDALKLNELSREETVKRLQWEAIETKYASQVAWRKMATCISRGMKDQTPDFNQIVSETLPASWQIQVDGRPTPEQLLNQEGPNEGHEDAVCMICFDGASKESNPILFCDGCNAALHQACYGIAEIPEGDFFCDRCRHVLVMTEDSDIKPPPYKILEMVKCCLCPQYHGGIKPTADGHWVHMCCTLWAKNSIIKDLKNMSPIDLSDVDCDITDPCVYCNLQGGYLQYCDCSEESCLNTFHPICAWFAGAKFESAITDVTFSGISRNGQYPSGVDVKIYCEKHDVSEDGRKAQQEQIRKKYSHKIEDQCHLPGRRVTNTSAQRKNKKKEAAAAVNQSRVASSFNKNQELKVDVYDLKNCAMCCEPFDKSTLHYETLDKIVCHGCSIYVHLKCLQEVSPDFEEGSSRFWTCDKCISFPAQPAPSEGTWPTCEFCPRRGGAYKPMPDDRWTHVFCASNCNGKKVLLPTGELDVKLTGKVDKKHKCALCNRKEGFLKCFNDGCSAYFHPLCAGRSARTYIKTSRDGLMVWCTDHLPKWLHRTMQGVWINCADIEFLRWTLTNAQGISNLVDNRIKLKRHEAKTAGDLFSARFVKLLENAKGRETIEENEENRWIFETEDIYDGPEDEQAIAAAALRLKREALVLLPPGEQIEVETSWGEKVTISATWTIGTTAHVPKKFFIQHAGVDITKRNTNMDPAQFKDKTKNAMRRQMQSSGLTREVFKQDSAVDEFRINLGDHLAKYCKMPPDLFTNEMAKYGVEVDQNMFPSKRKLKKEQQQQKGTPVTKKRKETKETSKATPQTERKLKHDYKFIEHEHLVTMLQEAPTLRNFCFSYVESKPTFEDGMDMLGIAENPGFAGDMDEWKLYDENELPNLERRLLDIITQILDYEVPLGHNSDDGNSKKSKKGAVETRKLTKDFADIDFDDEVPDYHRSVRRLLDITYIKERLNRHEYSSMAQFSKDFFDLINNARSYTNDSTMDAWTDAEELGRLFNEFKKTSVSNPNGYRHERNAIKAVKIFGRQSAASSETRIKACGICNENYMLHKWPDVAWPMELEERKGRNKSSWHWKCPSCVAAATSNGTFLSTKTDVKVWWIDDKQYYKGFINAYDEVSKRYRILYEDNEWEFINLDQEPVLFLNGDDNKNNHVNVANKKAKANNDDDEKESKSNAKNDDDDDGRRKSSRVR